MRPEGTMKKYRLLHPEDTVTTPRAKRQLGLRHQYFESQRQEKKTETGWSFYGIGMKRVGK